MCSLIRKEFRLRNLWLSYDKPEHFYTSQWGWPRPVYIIYRFLMAGYTIFAFVYVLVPKETNTNNPSNSTSTNAPVPYHAMVYLTIWTYLVLTCHFFLAFIIAVACYRKAGYSRTEPQLTNIKTGFQNATFTSDQGLVKENQKSVTFDNNENDVKISDGAINDRNLNIQNNSQPVDSDIKLPWYSKISWALSNIVSVFAIIVTSIFFGALYTPTGGISLNDLNVHALNTVFVFVDNCISARPVRLLHVIYPSIYGTIYVIFSVIFWGVDHSHVIYKVVLDWNNPGITFAVVLGIILFICVLHSVYFALNRLKIFLYKKMC